MSLPSKIKDLAKKVRNAVYGKDVREAIARSMEETGRSANRAEGTAKDAEKATEAQKNRVDNLIKENPQPDEVVDARTDVDGKSNDVLKDRLDKGQLRVRENEENQFLNSAVVHKSQPHGMITWIDDDGQKGFYEKLAPIAKDFNVKMTSALIINRIDDDRYMSMDQIEELQDNDDDLFEFISHTYDAHDSSNRPTEWDGEDYRADLKKSQKWLKEHGMNGEVFAIPFGDTNKRNQNIESEFFRASFDINSNNYVKNPFNQYKIGRLSIENDTSDIKDVLTEAAKKNKWVVIMCHIDQYEVTTDKVEEVIQHALDEGLEFVHTDKGLDHFGNVLQADTVSIGADRQLYRSLVAGKDDHDYEPNAPITDFPEDTFTNLKVRTNEKEEYGLDDYGHIMVYHDYEGGTFSYQIFTATQNENNSNGYQLIRYWDDDKWTDWRPLMGVATDKERYNYPDNNDLYDFPINRFTHFKVTADHKDKYGVDDKGMVLTYRDGNDAYSHQIFRPNQKYYTLYRYWMNSDNDDDRWSPWVKLNFDKKQTYTRTIHKQTVSAHSCVYRDLEVDTGGYTKFYAHPKNSIPDDTIWQVYRVEKGRLRVKLCNISDEDIKIDETDFEVFLEP